MHNIIIRRGARIKIDFIRIPRECVKIPRTTSREYGNTIRFTCHIARKPRLINSTLQRSHNFLDI